MTTPAMRNRGGEGRRVVAQLSPRHRKRSKLWAFGYTDLAAALGVSERTVKRRIASGELHPEDLGRLVGELAAAMALDGLARELMDCGPKGQCVFHAAGGARELACGRDRPRQWAGETPA
jgi:hypothetical protein